MKCYLSLGLMLALSFAGSAMAGHHGGYSSGCCCQGNAGNAQPVYSQPAVPAGTMSAAPAAGYRSYSYQPSASAAPAAAAVAAPAAVVPATTGYRSYSYMPSMNSGYLGAGYNPPASVRGFNAAGWKQRR